MSHLSGGLVAVLVLFLAVCGQADRISQESLQRRLAALQHKLNQSRSDARTCASAGPPGSGSGTEQKVGLIFVMPGCGREFEGFKEHIIGPIVTQIDANHSFVAVVAPTCATGTCDGAKPVTCDGAHENFHSCVDYMIKSDSCMSGGPGAQDVSFGEQTQMVSFYLLPVGTAAANTPRIEVPGDLSFDIHYKSPSSGGRFEIKSIIGNKYGANFDLQANLGMISVFVRVQRIEPLEEATNTGMYDACSHGCIEGVYDGRWDAGTVRFPEDQDDGFQIRMRRWQLVLSMANRLGVQRTDSYTNKVKEHFWQNAKAHVNKVITANRQALADFDQSLDSILVANSYTEFIRLLRPLLFVAAHVVGTPFASFLDSEYATVLSTLVGVDETAAKMRKFILVTKMLECRIPLLNKDNWRMLWSAWQLAQGQVRVYVRFTTPCGVQVPKNFDKFKAGYRNSVDNDGFIPVTNREGMEPGFGTQRFWDTCKDARMWDKNKNWPSAILSCSRSDDLDLSTNAISPRTDTLVRWLGCDTRDSGREPPTELFGLRQYCEFRGSGNPSINYNGNLCSQPSSEDCNIFGPFWAVYASPAYRLFGMKSEVEEHMLTQEGFTPISAASAAVIDAYGTIPNNVFTENCALTENGPNARLNATRGHFCGNPQTEGFKALLNEAAADYVYGSNPRMPGTYKFKNGKTVRRMKRPYFPLPYDRPSDPPLREVLEEVQSGGTVVLMAYGFSGAGKTTTLIGNSVPRVDGVLTHFLMEKSKVLVEASLTVAEIYGRINVATGEFVPDSGTGLWAFTTESSKGQAEFVGDWQSFLDGNGETDLNKIQAELFKYKKVMQGDINQQIQEALVKVEGLRVDATAFAQHSKGLAHIRGTANNPQSSRGALFVIIDMKFRGAGGTTTEGSVVVLDLAGAEDPAEMLKGFARMDDGKTKPNIQSSTTADSCCELLMVSTAGKVTCPTTGRASGSTASAGPASKGCRGDVQLRQNLHRVDDKGYYATPDGQCLIVKDFPILECTDMFNLKGCVKMQMPDDAVPKFYKADMDQKFIPDISKTGLSDKEAGVGFKATSAVGGSKNQRNYYQHDGRPPKIEFETGANMQTTLADLREELWDAVKGASPQDIDRCTFLQTWEANRYAEIKKTQFFKDNDKTSASALKPLQGAKNVPSTAEWSKEHMKSLKAAVAQAENSLTGTNNMVNFDRHLTFFTAIAADLVQEAVCINELLNELKLWISALITNASNVGKTDHAQVLSFDPTKDATNSYDMTQLIRAKADPDKMWNMQEFGKKDKLLGISILKMLQKRANLGRTNPEGNFWILFGTFARSDMPNGDPDCLGARRALAFGQQLIPNAKDKYQVMSAP